MAVRDILLLLVAAGVAGIYVLGIAFVTFVIKTVKGGITIHAYDAHVSPTAITGGAGPSLKPRYPSEEEKGQIARDMAKVEMRKD